MSNTLMNHSRSLSRQQLSRISGGGNFEPSYCHLQYCSLNGCAAQGGVPCKCLYTHPTDPGFCNRIR
ncbi:hypothetical protein [Chitinophaga nivalis]|uniref:Bacteriocin n=1 Tax=Chitinophaga nivalis TaxID=2991709 RepID=A0ABT3IND1_9BACT|nr:hypothetical protein [Chitinophaga nivalis]MCW3465079.1 hypothetical protein [Chitinophaga nivalis]MCW3485229.1 hypothetical protein [Chitinophaga nivalis]